MSETTTLTDLKQDRFSALRPFVPDTAWTTMPLHALERKNGRVCVDDTSAPTLLTVRIHGAPGSCDQVWIFAESATPALEGFIAALEPPTEILCAEPLGEVIAAHHPFAVAADHAVVWFEDIEATPEMERVDGLRRLRLSDAPEVEDLEIPGLLRTYETTKEVLMAGGGYGVVVDNEVVCAAVTVDTSVNHARIAVATQAPHRRKGFATACMRRLVKAHHGQGRLTCALIPGRDSAAEMVARRVGFQRAARVRSYTLRDVSE